jgi:hypothetical protein
MRACVVNRRARACGKKQAHAARLYSEQVRMGARLWVVKPRL